MHSVIFICTANRCRSPMAMTLMREKVKNLTQGDNWRIESAGTWADEGQPAMVGSQLVMTEKGFDLSHHQSQPLTGDLLRAFPLILTMESGQKEALQIEFPDLAGRVFMLSEMAGMRADIHDPVGKSLTDYRDVAGEIDSFINKGYERIEKLSQEDNL